MTEDSALQNIRKLALKAARTAGVCRIMLESTQIAEKTRDAQQIAHYRDYYPRIMRRTTKELKKYRAAVDLAREACDPKLDVDEIYVPELLGLAAHKASDSKLDVDEIYATELLGLAAHKASDSKLDADDIYAIDVLGVHMALLKEAVLKEVHVANALNFVESAISGFDVDAPHNVYGGTRRPAADVAKMSRVCFRLLEAALAAHKGRDPQGANYYEALHCMLSKEAVQMKETHSIPIEEIAQATTEADGAKNSAGAVHTINSLGLEVTQLRQIMLKKKQLANAAGVAESNAGDSYRADHAEVLKITHPSISGATYTNIRRLALRAVTVVRSCSRALEAAQAAHKMSDFKGSAHHEITHQVLLGKIAEVAEDYLTLAKVVSKTRDAKVSAGDIHVIDQLVVELNQLKQALLKKNSIELPTSVAEDLSNPIK